MTQEKGVVIRQPQELMEIKSPKETVALATAQANALMDVVEKKKLYQEIEGKKYLYVEAWETIGAFNRTHALTDWVRPLGETEVIGYEAKVELWKDGEKVGSAIMSCGLDEFPCRGKEGEAKNKAAKSAAQTWATSKAYRMNYSYVAVLAGYEPTPAEEMTGGETSRGKEHWCEEHNCAFALKKGKGGATWYAHQLPDGKWCNEAKKTSKQEPSQPEPISEQSEPKAGLDFDPDWLLDALKQTHWKDGTVKSYLKNIYHVDTEGEVVDVVARLTREDREKFFAEITERLTML